MSTKRVWITGAGGMIGSTLVATAHERAPDWEVRALTRSELDLLNLAAVRLAFARERPDAVIHCAALVRNSECERDPSLARRVNVEATALLSGLAADIPFYFFSTDLVFDGARGNYAEPDTVNPLTVYAKTKADAEPAVLANPRHTVIRTSLTGGRSPSGDRGFSDEMRRAWEAGRTLTLFTDEFRSPLPAVVTTTAVWSLFRRGATGLFHLAGAEKLSRWQIGALLAARWPHLGARMVPGSIKDYAGPPRSPDTSLDCTKVQALLPFRIPGLGEWLAANPTADF